MKHLLYIIAGFALCCMTFCTKERLSNPLSNYLTDYYCYRVEITDADTLVSDTYYFQGSSQLLDFQSWYGVYSPNIFDFDGSGTVNNSDLNDVLSGYGVGYTPPFDIYAANVTDQFSSGWLLDIDGFTSNFAVLSVTPYDENGKFIPDTLNSFFITGDISGQTHRYWFYTLW